MDHDNTVFVCSQSNYKNIKIIPETNSQEYIPSSGNLVKSSACVDFSKIDITFRNVYEEEGISFASDADFWNRLNIIIKKKIMNPIVQIELLVFMMKRVTH